MVVGTNDLPSVSSGVAVRGEVFICGMGAKPWEADWNTSSDGLVFFKKRFFAHEKNGIGIDWGEGCDMSTMEIDCACRLGMCDVAAGEAAFADFEAEHIGDGVYFVKHFDGLVCTVHNDLVLHADF